MTSSMRGLMEAFKIDGGAFAYMVADLPTTSSLSVLSDSMSTSAFLSVKLPSMSNYSL